MAKLFFSYSHRNEDLRNELEIHLASLKRQGILETWHDRRIGSGEEIDRRVSEHLESSDIILLLVSPYFIASDYCYDVEMDRAMQRHDLGEARVIPTILQPCDWHDLPFGKLLATPTDGKPVTKFPDPHDAFYEVVRAIRRAAEELDAIRSGDSATVEEPQQGTSDGDAEARERHEKPTTRSSNLRVKKQFDDHEKDRFLDEAFDYVANYFEGSLSELEKRNAGIETRFRRIDSNRFTATVYLSGSLGSSCQVRMETSAPFAGSIAYSASESARDNSFNESLSVTDDGYSLFLKPLGLFMRNMEKEELTLEGAAEYYWSKLMEPLQL